MGGYHTHNSYNDFNFMIPCVTSGLTINIEAEQDVYKNKPLCLASTCCHELTLNPYIRPT